MISYLYCLNTTKQDHILQPFGTEYITFFKLILMFLYNKLVLMMKKTDYGM